MTLDNDATASALGEYWAGGVGAATTFASVFMGNAVVAAARADDAFSRATGLGSEHQSSSTATDFAAIVLQKELVPLRQGLLLPDNLIGSEGIPAHMRG